MRNKGFTLIELMVVVVIIGILAAIAIPNFMRMQQRAKESSVKGNMHTLQLCVEDYATLNRGAYPDDNTTTTWETNETLEDLKPGGLAAQWFVNPFLGTPQVPVWAAGVIDPKTWNAAVLTKGQVAYVNDATGASPNGDGQRYAIFGGSATDFVPLGLILSNY